MKEEKLTFIKQKELQRKAKANLESFGYVQNPINSLKNKFLAFQKTKKEIDSKDLF